MRREVAMRRRNTSETERLRRTMPLKAGTRVRVRQEADSPLAGRKGIVMYVGDGICDVKVVEKQKGSRYSEITIETLPKEALESVRRNVDLVSMPTQRREAGWRSRFLWGVTAAVVVFGGVLVAHVTHW